MKVTVHGIENLAIFVAEMVKRGIQFEAHPDPNDVGIDRYEIELTGGY